MQQISQLTQASPTRTFPVVDPVADYERLGRVGEGTYGVVCEFPGSLVCRRCFWTWSFVLSTYPWALQSNLPFKVPKDYR